MSNDSQINQRAADNIRILSLSMVEKAKSGHPGGAMGGADFAHILFSEYLVYDPNCPEWFARDRFFLDPGHMSPMLYSTLALTGKYSMDDLKSFRQWGSVTPGHPELDVARGVENTSGPLGQGHVFAVGAAIAAKKMRAHFGDLMRQRIFAFISDGGIQEEISQGAGRIAGHLGLDNLVLFYDSNDIQLSTTVTEVSSEDVAKKYEAWGWMVQTIDGNDQNQIRQALDTAIAVQGKPALIIGKTRMGKGAFAADGSSFENKVSTHGQPLSAAGGDPGLTVRKLGGDPEDPFQIFPEVADLYEQRKRDLGVIVQSWRGDFERWRRETPELAEELDKWFTPGGFKVDWASIEQAPNKATRAASATVLSHLAIQVPNMVVASADLSNSDKTDGFLKKTKEITREDFSGGFLQAGVSELTMACLCIGLSLHGGIVPACGTFFVFSDYMKPAIRLAALMKQPVKFVWTHDAFRVGEDGPTHEPVEQEAQIRLLEKLKNHTGERSMLVLRPADVHETTAAWQVAMETYDKPVGLIFSRQDIMDLPQSDFVRARQLRRGGYVVVEEANPEVLLVASGSEVSTLVAGAKLLKDEGIRASVVSIPSEGLFRDQSKEYQDSVLPIGVPRFGLTAGLPVTLSELIGNEGMIWGLETFGYSAPYKVLDEKLGFTSDNVLKQVKKLLRK